MTSLVPTQISPLSQCVLGRSESYFAADLDSLGAELSQQLAGSRILVIGGAGTIGASTIRTILRFHPELIDVVDHNENGLAELVRSLRSADDVGPLPEMLFLPFDVGGDPFRLWLASRQTEYDHVLNFSALKHVRTEKDPFAILAMLETNVLHLDRLARLLRDQSRIRRVFSVSTDKAANPSSMMGATKRLMEHALFLPTQPWAPTAAVASARFANVAFSNGSLLQAWQYRMASEQPLAVPEQTRRFFVSIEESGHLCTLAAMVGDDRHIAVPALDPSEHLVLLTDVVERFLGFNGYEARFTEDETEAVGRVREFAAVKQWPVLVTKLDTGGEKPYEEFVAVDEHLSAGRFISLDQVEYRPPATPSAFAELVAKLRVLLAGESPNEVSDQSIRDLIATVEPAFLETHRHSTKSLDQRI